MKPCVSGGFSMRILLVLLVVLWPAHAPAQQSYVQIEAHPSLADARSRARGYGGLFPNVNGFLLSRRWYGLALGPYPSPAAAESALLQFLSQGLVPRDSYVTQSGTYRERFWPQDGPAPFDAGAEALATLDRTAPGATPDASIATTPLDPQAETPAAPSRPREETRREARASEALLDRTAREDLQRALKWFGHYRAAIDGSFGAGTRGSMAAWQVEKGFERTGVLTTRQRATLISEWRAAQAALGLAPLEMSEAGIALTAPMGLVRFDRIEAPFVHYASEDGSGMRLTLISQAGDREALAGLYEVLQTLEMIPLEGPRGKERDAFRIRGEARGRTSQALVRLEGGHVFGWILSWPDAQADAAARALTEMEATMRSTGAPLDADAGFDAAEQRFDMVSGLEVRKPLRSASGFFVDQRGTVVTAAANVAGCARVTLDWRHDAQVVAREDAVAVLRPTGALAPARVAALAPQEGRLRSAVAVGGYPYGGVLGAATLSFGTLEDVRGLGGEADLLRLSLKREPGDAGGPVLDRAGNVAGLLLPGAGDDRALPGDVAFAVKSRTILPMLADAGVAVQAAAGSAPLAPEALSRRATAITVLVGCWE